MDFENTLIQKLKQFNIEHLSNKNFGGSEGTIYGCKYKSQNCWQQCILKVVTYEEENLIQQEVNIYNKLSQEFKNNENLITIINVIHVKDLKSVCILMEECETNLSIYKGNLSSKKSILIFFQQFLKGYKSLYDQRIIHRDIKPENILIKFKGKEPIYQLTDFGLSKLCQQFNNTQSKIGTQLYAAPELSLYYAKNDLLIDHEKLSKIDVYSLGIVLYDLHFKKLPFEKVKQQKEFHTLSLKDRLQKLGQQKQDQSFVTLILYMIQSNPDERVEFKELYECYHENLDKFEQNCNRLADKFMISQAKQSRNAQTPFNNNQRGQYSPNKQQGLNLNLNPQQQFSIDNQQLKFCQTDRGNYKQFKQINFFQ